MRYIWYRRYRIGTVVQYRGQKSHQIRDNVGYSSRYGKICFQYSSGMPLAVSLHFKCLFVFFPI